MISIYSIALSLFVGTFLPPPFLGVVWYLMAEPDYHDMYYDANNKKECESIGGAWEAFEPYCINSDYGKFEIKRLKQGFGKDNLNVKEFKEFLSLKLSLPEQQQIVDDIKVRMDANFKLIGELYETKNFDG